MANLLQAASDALSNINTTLANTRSAIDILDRLDAAVPTSRALRAPKVKVTNIQIKATYLPNGVGIPVVATAVTGEGGYTTRITFHPKQGFHCTCPDLQQRKHACKHVAALAVECRKRFWAIQGLLENDYEALSVRYANLEDAVTTLAGEATSSLGSFKGALES